MNRNAVQILLVERDRELAEMIGRCLAETMWSQVTHVASVADALREELTASHDVVLASMALPDSDGLTLARELRVTNDCPVILMADNPTVAEAIEAIRVGVTDLLTKPFDMAHMSAAVRQAAERESKRQREQLRHRRLRRVASRIVRERRDLRQRLDLICRDLVHAYRGLAQKVAASGVLTAERAEEVRSEK